MSNIKIFTTQDNEVCLEVSLHEETVWLSQAQMVMLFGRNQSTIARHISNVFTEGELEEKSNMQKMHIANSDKPVRFFNLDVIISVGYRVKSERGVQFRKWATSVLKQYLIEGYALNQKRLQERNIEFEQVLSLLTSTLSNQSLVNQDGELVLGVVHEYARSWSLLQGYDEQSLEDNKSSQKDMLAIQLHDALKAIETLKLELISKGEATELFGKLRGNGLASALATIEQGFGDELFYPNVASRAAHLLYFIIKNHPLADGNKRSGSFLFLWYLRLNQAFLAKNIEQLINDNTLVALALLVAESKPNQKELMIR
ncbi:virulence protein RhuM/Fic/DOC family protein [Thiomicrorhabdus sp. Milos-T2]|uniref:virulence protein RhuM/Fic/DOC family protein n=1 Tax=Thiomicrorhabdus sp. Milos-T2 TaxID=90814 RepID=UPI00049466EA|nr:virulence protein RhuM/Fic/DOC family protein [Thiomicrorhabdus sp. Milos-T2]